MRTLHYDLPACSFGQEDFFNVGYLSKITIRKFDFTIWGVEGHFKEIGVAECMEMLKKRVDKQCVVAFALPVLF